MSLPADAAARKRIPIFRGFVQYFPDAIALVAHLSLVANEQHNPGDDLFWDRSKSGDEYDALMRHLLDPGAMDSDGLPECAKVAWRAMAGCQKWCEENPEYLARLGSARQGDASG